MTVYIVMLAISLFFSIYAANDKPYPALKVSYNLLAVLSAIPFILVTVLRYRVGTDWAFIYEPYYYYINHGITQFREIGFNLLAKFLYIFTEDSWYLFAVIGFATILLFFLAIYKQSAIIPFSILLFFISNRYFTSLNQIRQQLAVAIFVYSLKYIYARKWKEYFFCILIATSMHMSSIMYIPLYFLYGFVATVKRHLVIFVGCAVSMPILGWLFKKIISKTSYGWYFSSEFDNNNFYMLGFLVGFFLWVIHVFYIDKLKGDRQYEFMSNMMLISTIIMLFSAVLPQVLRVAEAFSVVAIFSFPKIIDCEKNNKKKLLLFLMIVTVLSAKLFYDIYVNHWHGVIPYTSIFSR